MKKTMKTMAAIALCAVAVAAMLSSCSTTKKAPTQQEIEKNIIGRWRAKTNSLGEVTANRTRLETFGSGGKMYVSEARDQRGVFYWNNKHESEYKVENDTLLIGFNYEKTGPEKFLVLGISKDEMHLRFMSERAPGSPTELHFQRITADYVQDIIGTWETAGGESDEIYAGTQHRIEYKPDGTYAHSIRSGDDWTDTGCKDAEYFVDGDFLAMRRTNQGDESFTCECWIIDSIKADEMKWSALREKEDGTRFTTTFTWKRVK